MSIFSFFERYFFKVRHIMVYEEAQEVSVRVKSYSMDQVEVNGLIASSDERLASLFEMRRDSQSWLFFECVENGARLGYGFLHIPSQTEWNDSLPTLPGEARIGSAYVYPEYRGKGVRGEIFTCQSKYAHEENLKLWSVIERSNRSSMKAALKTGRVERNNYLIKIAKRNVFSILANPLEIYALYGSRRARR